MMHCDIVILGYNGAICTVRLKMLLIGVLILLLHAKCD